MIGTIILLDYLSDEEYQNKCYHSVAQQECFLIIGYTDDEFAEYARRWGKEYSYTDHMALIKIKILDSDNRGKMKNFLAKWASEKYTDKLEYLISLETNQQLSGTFSDNLDKHSYLIDRHLPRGFLHREPLLVKKTNNMYRDNLGLMRDERNAGGLPFLRNMKIVEDNPEKSFLERIIQIGTNKDTNSTLTEEMRAHNIFHVGLSYQLMNNKQEARAIHYYRSYLKEPGSTDDGVWYARFAIGTCFHIMKKFDSAIYEYTLAWNNNPKRSEPLASIALLCIEQKIVAPVPCFCEEGLRINRPKFPFYLSTFTYKWRFDLCLGIASYFRKDIKSAQRYIKKVIRYKEELDPNFDSIIESILNPQTQTKVQYK